MRKISRNELIKLIKNENFKELENCDVSEIDKFECLFRCSKITTKDLKYISKWDVSNVKVCWYMFAFCKNIKSLKYLKNWNVSNVYNFSLMFYNCHNLEYLEGLENWDVFSKTARLCLGFKWNNF